MSSVVTNAAKSVGKAAGAAAGKTIARDRTLQKGAKRDPELYVR
jgi:hypothetical protein